VGNDKLVAHPTPTTLTTPTSIPEGWYVGLAQPPDGFKKSSNISWHDHQKYPNI